MGTHPPQEITRSIRPTAVRGPLGNAPLPRSRFDHGATDRTSAGWRAPRVAFRAALAMFALAGGLPLSAQDCSAAPSEAWNLRLSGAGASQLTWYPAQNTGGAPYVLYDALRSTSAAGFASAACLASGLSQTNYTESNFAGSAFYLVRSRNTCGGTLGYDSSGSPISGASCPTGAGGQCFASYECATNACCAPGYCRDLAADPDHCTTCTTVCDATNSLGRGCDGTRCTYTGCAAGRANCNTTAPDSAGCECAGTGCCGSSCQTSHVNGLGQTFYNCTPRGVPGNPGTYTHAMAVAARAAWPVSGVDMTSYCTVPFYFDVVFRQTPTSCAVWAFTGPYAGFVLLNTSNNTCWCPSNSNMIWN